MKIHTDAFRVRQGDEVNLNKRPTIVDPVYKSKADYKKLLAYMSRSSVINSSSSMARTAKRCFWCFRPWTRRGRTAPFGM